MSRPIYSFEEFGVLYSRDERAGKEKGWTEGVYACSNFAIDSEKEAINKIWFIGNFADLCVLVNGWNMSGAIWKYTALYAGKAGGYEKNQR